MQAAKGRELQRSGTDCAWHVRRDPRRTPGPERGIRGRVDGRDREVTASGQIMHGPAGRGGGTGTTEALSSGGIRLDKFHSSPWTLSTEQKQGRAEAIERVCLSGSLEWQPPRWDEMGLHVQGCY